MSRALGPDEARRIAAAALDAAGPDHAEVVLMSDWAGLTRFAGSSIHQSTAREERALKVRVVRDGRVGVATTNDLRDQGAASAARDAAETAAVAAPDPLFPGLAPAREVPGGGLYDEATADTSPTDRADAVTAVVAACGTGFRASGAYETGATELAVANSKGQFAHAVRSKASLSTVVSGEEDGAGHAERTAARASDLDPGEIGRRAFEKARDSRSPRDLDPGDYEVVLEPPAVTTLLAFLSYLGFGGRTLAEGRSCLTGREGERVVSDLVSIWDDALSPETIGFPFDFEGTPKQRVDMIEKGVFLSAVHDRRSALRVGGESTGHALPPPNPAGAFPVNLFMATGDTSVTDMVRSTSRGLLVSRFHYSNVVQPMESIITGMTRDGTWLIENGEIAYPVKNLRFTDSILRALSTVDAVGTETQLASEFFFEASRVPALRLSSFRFTGRSDH